MKLVLQKCSSNSIEFKIVNKPRWFGYFYLDNMIYTDANGNPSHQEGYYTELSGYYLWEDDITFHIS